MNRTLIFFLQLGLLLSLLTACQSRPFRTVMRGAFDMDGTMRVDGDMQMAGDMTTSMKTDNTASRLASTPVYHRATQVDHQAATIVVVDVDGVLLNQNSGGFGSLGENPVALFREKLDAIAEDSRVAAIVLRINSPGGGVTATDIMTRDLMQVQQQRNLPVVACLMDVGAGGGYYLATAADEIVAHPTSLVGGIGVIFNTYNLEDALGQFGVVALEVKAGEKIDISSPTRSIQPNERELLQQLADTFHQRFIQRVESTRPVQGLDQADDLPGLYDGRIVTGERALKRGLVDRIGYLDDAVSLARQLAGINDAATISMLRRDNDRAYTLMDVTPNTPTTGSIIPLSIPGLDRSRLPTFMYLWQPDPVLVTNLGP